MGPRSPSAPAPKPPTPTEVIMAAVHHCADQVLPHGGGALTISSTLIADVNGDGTTRIVRFDPPLHPDMQSCVSEVAYATRWTEAGEHRIPIELHR
jgi:hypothetical protein